LYNSFLNRDKFNYLFKIYLTFLGILGFYHLFLKHTGGADSTISEWLINYQGGFTKRGIIGEICFIIAKFFGLKLRFIIYLFQVLTLGTYFFCLYHFIKTIKINYLILLIIFSPIFLLYPFAELEVLARKEVFIFIGLIVFIIFAFGWNPKTSLTGDVGSFPGYRVPYYFFKTVFNNFD